MRYETYEVDNRRVIIINYEDRYIYLINGVYIYIYFLLIRTNVYIYYTLKPCMHGVARPNKLYYYLLIIYILYISLLIYLRISLIYI